MLCLMRCIMHPFSINIWSYYHHVKERMFYAWKETSFRREPSWLVSWCALLLQDVHSDTLLRALLLDFTPQGMLQFLWLIDLHIRNGYLSYLITYRGIIHWTSRCMQDPFLLNLRGTWFNDRETLILLESLWWIINKALSQHRSYPKLSLWKKKTLTFHSMALKSKTWECKAHLTCFIFLAWTIHYCGVLYQRSSSLTHGPIYILKAWT